MRSVSGSDGPAGRGRGPGGGPRRTLALLVAAGLTLAGSTGCGDTRPEPGAGPPEQSRIAPAAPTLSALRPCDPADLGAPATPAGQRPVDTFAGVVFSCGQLTVPLAHPGLHPDGDPPGSLSLQVAVADNAGAPRGLLVRLVGGPGEPGVKLAADLTAHEIEPSVSRAYRLVFVNPRGTGRDALECPALQAAMGDSDLAVPPDSAVQACAAALGPNRRFYTTADTVADLETLRVALGADKLSLDGSSYGAFVAERYALAFPGRVDRLVLDSVVPHSGLDPLEVDAFARTAEVLGMACHETACAGDPAQDLAQVVRARHDGPELLDLLAGRTAGRPRLGDLPAALHVAAAGDYGPLEAILAAERRDAATPADHLSQGLHTATECEDLGSTSPWGGAATPVAGRAEATARAVAAIPERALFPFDRATAAGNGTVLICQNWPASPVPSIDVARDLPAVPTLLLAGDQDLDTPLAWTRQEAARAPRGQLVVIPGSGHITQDAANGPAGRRAVAAFLTGP